MSILPTAPLVLKVLDVYDPSAVKLLAFFKVNICDIVSMVMFNNKIIK